MPPRLRAVYAPRLKPKIYAVAGIECFDKGAVAFFDAGVEADASNAAADVVIPIGADAVEVFDDLILRGRVDQADNFCDVGVCGIFFGVVF